MHTAQDGTASLARTAPRHPFRSTDFPPAVLFPPGARLKTDAPVRNDLLSALPADDLARLRPRLERVSLKRRQVLQERNLPISHAFFIEDGAASLLSRSKDGATAMEVGTLGREDIAGVPIVLGTAHSPHRCVVQVAGEALRIRADDLRQAMDEMPALQQLLLGYVQAVMVQSAQLVVCSARHSLRERIARWILVAHDRLDGNEIAITHQALARALGVRRAGVTTAMGRMEEAGLLRRGRGRILVLDRAGLEGTACDCYRVICAEHLRIVSGSDEPDPSRAWVLPGLGGSGETRPTVPAALGQSPLGGDGSSAGHGKPDGPGKQRTEAEFRQALADKDERFRDLHHRMKNSLQMISSLLVLETRGIADRDAASRLEDAQDRIQTLVRIHERLYAAQDGGAEEIDAAAQLTALCEELARSTGAVARGVAIVVNAQPCPIPFDKLTPLALLVSELVTNAVKHAAPAVAGGTGTPARITVTFGPDSVAGFARLSVFDTGPGLPADFDLQRPAGLGLRLVSSFARQLGGTLSVDRGGGNGSARSGAGFTLSFPLGR